jgi:trigger factor
MRETAAQAVKVDLALRAIADAEAIEATDAEVETELEQVAARVQQPLSRVRDDLERGGQMQAVRSDIRKRKALDWLEERVEIVDEEGAPIDREELDAPTDLESEASDDTDDAPQDEEQ